MSHAPIIQKKIPGLFCLDRTCAWKTDDVRAYWSHLQQCYLKNNDVDPTQIPCFHDGALSPCSLLKIGAWQDGGKLKNKVEKNKK